jgi:FAM177 family
VLQQSIESLAGDQPTEKKKVPRRILHFSDGILEEYSTDEDEEIVDISNERPVDPVS